MTKALLRRPILQFDLETVALAGNRVDAYPFEDLAVPPVESTREIADIDS